MSVANILGADGKIASAYLPAAAPPAGLVTNPLTANLDCSGFEVTAASYVRTDVVECETLEPKLLGSFIECVADLQMGVGAEIRTETLKVDVAPLTYATAALEIGSDVRIRTATPTLILQKDGVLPQPGGKIEYSDAFNELKLVPQAGASGSVSIQQDGGALPQLNFYDISRNVFGNITLDGSFNILTDSDLTIQNATPQFRMTDTTAGSGTATFTVSKPGPVVEVSLNQALVLTSSNGARMDRMTMTSGAVEVNGGGIIGAGAPAAATNFITFRNNGATYRIPCVLIP